MADANTSARRSPSAEASLGNSVAMITSPALSTALGMASQIAMALLFSFEASASINDVHPLPSLTNPGKHSEHSALGTTKPWRWHFISFFLSVTPTSLVPVVV